ncbi:MAG: SMC-Scp complex subunit ScpB [Candidatus Margulisbacteria bacterium]|nr:SMC-Scp complex subunit ScpB [Candidatus Margulisiibacteriota bacterium]
MTSNMENQSQSNNLKGILESILFIARKPLAPKDLEESVQMPREVITAALEELVSEYEGKGINVVKVAGGYLMGTNPLNADYVHTHLHAKVQTTLTHQALEVLAIIAYKQPVTRAEMERIRGVNSDGPIDTLVQKKLIQELGRSEAVGRPFLYGTTTEFLRHFGLKDLTTLPPLPVSQEEQDELFKTALQE